MDLLKKMDIFALLLGLSGFSLPQTILKLTKK